MPAEFGPHERTLVAWPTERRRAVLWGDVLDDARAAHAALVHAVARHEPVTVVADIADAEDAARACGAGVEVVALPIDDSWMRDTGPIVVRADGAGRIALDFRFNGWGGKYATTADDERVAARVGELLGLPVHPVDLVLEGGAVAVDGAGTLVTTERCLLNPNRNPGRSRADIEATLRSAFGADRVVWLADAIAEDDETDGHVDNVVAFVGPGRALLQGCDDPGNPNAAIAADNRDRLAAAGIEVIEVPVLPYADVAGETVPVPYVNCYFANGVVAVPVCGDPADEEMLTIIGTHSGGRDVVPIPGAALAYGGGGVHCITQQVPA